MAKAMKYRNVARALRDQGCTPQPGKGDHEKWYCSCGERHMVSITKPGDISPGLIRQAIANMKCLPKGWLQ